MEKLSKPTLNEQYVAWYESLRADGTLKNRTLNEMRQRFKPVRLYANSFTVRDTQTAQTFRIRFFLGGETEDGDGRASKSETGA